MRVMTWNINSVRLRAELVLRAAAELRADVICLQETKTPDEFFPHDVFDSAGFKHRHIQGMKGYNGVAILSKIPFEDVTIHHHVGREDCRHIAVNYKNFELHNLYIPAGGDIPDRLENEKFGHKLDFVDELTEWFGAHYSDQSSLMVVGDFNIAPYEHDVWSHQQLLKIVSHTPIEVEKLTAFRAGLDWVDVGRHFVPMGDKLYTWWSYRNRDWKKSNRGRRLDHIWVTPSLQSALKSHDVLTSTRDWVQTSDHVPVMVELTIERL
ncbi:MAG: exodeoxyribonuclease III [Alphaproteobacteria bacterium]|nr:exodeoxyribonuclease III [Alphaproteobacteria bacterium]MCB1550618.1 exodeoxyribonuclease III [Alphaproteobacteria bacterium]MCB9985483.1 exodeoxyribonuclease III [Micavibrio sp.]HPQ50337.1 exodeoxyribonuclease III [Alphaproteobacteria bacterium]